MTQPNFSPNVHDISDVSDAVRLGGWLLMQAVGAGLGAAEVMFGRQQQTAEQRGDQRFSDARGEEMARQALGYLGLRL
jgi:uncharacterized protein HemX